MTEAAARLTGLIERWRKEAERLENDATAHDVAHGLHSCQALLLRYEAARLDKCADELLALKG